MDLHNYDGKRIAVVMSIEGTQHIVTGVASCVDDAALGRALRIAGEDSPGFELLIVESQWEGTVEEGSEYGCDFCFRTA